ncbi:MAG: ATP synthase subunit I [Syntrophobacteraceae bacterium]|jgi:F1F0 ATPase subunit 2|nr:ATP synthase subunit I [Syntrophobacteraceae bacterium]
MGEWVNRIVEYSRVLAAGMLVGAFYFGGLWWTVRRVARSRRPGLLMLASYWLRTAVALALFYVIMEGGWVRLVVCLAGFLVMRQLLTWILGPGGNWPQARPAEVTPHEDHA